MLHPSLTLHNCLTLHDFQSAHWNKKTAQFNTVRNEQTGFEVLRGGVMEIREPTDEDYARSLKEEEEGDEYVIPYDFTDDIDQEMENSDSISIDSYPSDPHMSRSAGIPPDEAYQNTSMHHGSYVRPPWSTEEPWIGRTQSAPCVPCVPQPWSGHDGRASSETHGPLRMQSASALLQTPPNAYAMTPDEEQFMSQFMRDGRQAPEPVNDCQQASEPIYVTVIEPNTGLPRLKGGAIPIREPTPEDIAKLKQEDRKGDTAHANPVPVKSTGLNPHSRVFTPGRQQSQQQDDGKAEDGSKCEADV